MADVTFRLIDFGFIQMGSVAPTVEFVPKFKIGSAAVQASSPASRLLPSKPIAATLDFAGNGLAVLVPNVGTTPETWYEVRITYLDSAGNFTSYDVLGLKIWVTPEGGDLLDLPGVAPAPDFVLVSTDPPPPGYTGWYYNGGVGDPNDPLETGTGELYKVVAQ